MTREEWGRGDRDRQIDKERARARERSSTVSLIFQ